MLVGTGSDVGKSVLNAALCRIFKQDGYSPAPFKAQNMSLNSFVTPDGGEIGRAQAVQAEACQINCHVDMNPVLLKPGSNVSSQVIVSGKPIGNFKARHYFDHAKREQLFNLVTDAFNRLASTYNPMVIEGAGSISELNLKHNDIVNMPIAKATKAATFLIADIDRGGVFGSIYGSIELLDPEERACIKGILINKFRGDISLFEDGRKILEDLTGVPVIGVIPAFTDIFIEDEDSVVLERKKRTLINDKINIAVVLLRHMSNFTDFDRLDQDRRVNLFFTNQEDDLRAADIIIIPGSKCTIKDMLYLRKIGLASVIHQLAHQGKAVIGICGGYQMMGQRIEDPDHVESEFAMIPGIGILPTVTSMVKEKQTIQTSFYFKDNKALAKGYEIHMGRTELVGEATPLNRLEDNSTEGYAVNSNCWGTYMHGILDNEMVISDLLAPFSTDKNSGFDYETFKQQEYDKLADHVRKHIDMTLVYSILNGEA